MITVFLLLVFLPIVLPSGTVSAQSTSYSISKVDHNVIVMYSGQVVIEDTIHVSGQVTDGFMIGLPASYRDYVLKAVAYDQSNIYQINVGVQLGDRSGFYGAEVNFNGKSPSEFTVAFILSNNLVSFDQTDNVYILNCPAYPSLAQNVGSCDVNITLPGAATGVTVSKSDGEVFTTNYITQNLPAYTYSIAQTSFQVPTGTLKLASISQLNRQITIDPSGKVTSSDSYVVVNNSPASITSFVLGLPDTASNVVVKDEFGRSLTIDTSSTSNGILRANATLKTFVTSGQRTTITAQYNLPSATIQGSQYNLGDFKLFPAFNYYVAHAIFTFAPPEGATIVTPQLSSLDSSSTVTRDSLQNTLTVTKDGISFLDYNVPQSIAVQLSYNYNPVWASFRPTIWALVFAVVGCVAVVFFRRRKPTEKAPIITRTERSITPKPTETTTPQQEKVVEPAISQRVNADIIRDFTDNYEDKKRLNTELKSLDSRAQKGKMPRRQYKVQRRALEIRLEALTRNIDRLKDVFRSSSGYVDLMKQLDSAEADLLEAEESIKGLDTRQSKGEISIETYKKDVGDYQKRKDKAETTVNGILLRLREKIR